MKISQYIEFEKLLLLNYKKIGLSDDEALLLLISYAVVENGTSFINPADLALLCNFTTTKIDVIYSGLTQKGYITTDILEDGHVITSFDNITAVLIEKMNEIVMKNSTSEIDDKDMDMFKYMEKFFGRLLTPLEYDVIQTWKNKKYSAQLVKAASEIAQQAGNKSIRYIDTIIYEETKKQELGAEEYQKRQQETVELSRVDWLNK